jgi:hypothetical protein
MKNSYKVVAEKSQISHNLADLGADGGVEN